MPYCPVGKGVFHHAYLTTGIDKTNYIGGLCYEDT